MKKLSIIIATCILTAAPLARGQGTSGGINNPTAMELNYARTLWFNSDNAAGLAIGPLAKYNIVSASYNNTSGDFKSLQRGDKETSIAFNTNGSQVVGGVALWGDFSFSRDYWTGASFNTNMYTPDPDMPYYVSDNSKGDWNKQYYDMSVKAASPLFWNTVSVGISANYFARKGAKQIDPRGVPIGYGINVAPSLAVRINRSNSAGVSAFYSNGYESCTFSNTLETGRAVYVMKGLGNFTLESVSSLSGINHYVYPQSGYGASLQYALNSAANALLELQYGINEIDAIHDPEKRQMMGSAKKKTLAANLQLLWGDDPIHKITINATQTDTDGIEYVQEYREDENGLQTYHTLATTVMSNYVQLSGFFGYELFFGSEGGYSWKTGANFYYTDRYDQYYIPKSVFSYNNVFGELFVNKYFKAAKRSGIFVNISGGYNYNLSNDYSFSGRDDTHVLIATFYPHELEYYSADYLKLHGGVDYCYYLKDGNTIDLGVSWRYFMPVAHETKRSILDFSLSLLF